jgi:colanic acid biosynthesis glycosyl transferase WcaI
MRLLFLGLNHAPEEIGIGPYSAELLRAWVAAGNRADAVVGQPYYPQWRVLPGYRGGWRRSVEHGVRLLRCPLYVPARPTGLRRIVHHLSFAAASLAPMLWRAWRARPELVMTVAPSLIAAPVALIAARLTGAKSWLHVQDFELEAAQATGLVAGEGLLARMAAGFERRMLKGFDRVSTISPQMCAQLIAKGVPPDRVVEVRNWAEIDAIQPLAGPSPYRAEWRIAAPHVALYSGNIANKQGIEIVIEAARVLAHRTDLAFVICGDGPNRANLERLAAGLPNVQLHDLQPRERLGELLGLASVHLLPQLADAADLVLPSKMANMLASGRPVVATAAPGTGVANELSGCGVVVAPGDAAAFARAIEALIDDPARAAALGASGRERAEQCWSRDAILPRFFTQATALTCLVK